MNFEQWRLWGYVAAYIQTHLNIQSTKTSYSTHNAQMLLTVVVLSKGWMGNIWVVPLVNSTLKLYKLRFADFTATNLTVWESPDVCYNSTHNFFQFIVISHLNIHVRYAMNIFTKKYAFIDHRNLMTAIQDPWAY